MNTFDNVISQTIKAIKQYFKGLLILGTINFLVLCVGLYVLDISMWGLKALGVAILDMIPVLGSGMIMIPWAIIRALTGSISTGAGLAIIYVILVLVKLIGEPMIVGKSVGVPPLLTFGMTVVLFFAFGPIGAVIAGVISIPIKVMWSIFGNNSTLSTKENTKNINNTNEDIIVIEDVEEVENFEDIK